MFSKDLYCRHVKNEGLFGKGLMHSSIKKNPLRVIQESRFVSTSSSLTYSFSCFFCRFFFFYIWKCHNYWLARSCSIADRKLSYFQISKILKNHMHIFFSRMLGEYYSRLSAHLLAPPTMENKLYIYYMSQALPKGVFTYVIYGTKQDI